MKHSITVVLLLLSFNSFGQVIKQHRTPPPTPEQRQRTFTISLPEYMVKSFWNGMQNRTDSLYINTILPLVRDTLNKQAKVFFTIDSVARSAKLDTTKK